MLKAAKGYSPFINLNLSNAGTLDGTVHGSPVIDGAFVSPTTSDYAVLSIQKRPLTEMTMRWKGTVDYTNSPNYATCFGWSNGSVGWGRFTCLFRDAAGRNIYFAISDGAGNGTRIDTSIELEDDVVYDIVGVWRGGQDLEIYVDGVDVSDTKTNSGSTVTTIPISAMDEICLHALAAAGNYPLIGRTMAVQVFDKAFSAEAVKDLYEQDTIPEINRPLISLPLRSSYYKETGTQLLADGDMEADDTSAWSPNGCALTKETDNPHGGSQYMKVERTGGTAQAMQGILTSGKRYKVTGWARSGDGSTEPRVYSSSTQLWGGTSSTDWQEIDVEFVASTTVIGLYAGTTMGDISHYDDMRVELMENLTENKGTQGGTAKLGDGSDTDTMPTQLSPKGYQIGSGDYLKISNLVSGVYTVVALVEKDSLSTGYVFDARLAGGTGYFYYLSGTGLSSPSGTAYVDGEQSDQITAGRYHTVAVAGITLEITNDLIVMNRDIFSEPWIGNLLAFKVFKGTLTPVQMRIEHNKLIKEQNL